MVDRDPEPMLAWVMRPIIRWNAIAIVAALLPGLGLFSTACRQSPPAAPAAAEPASVRVYVGTYTSGDSKGIYPR